MRIAVDGSTWFNPRGYGRFTRELLPRLVRLGDHHEFVVLTESARADEIEIDDSNVSVHGVACRESPTVAASSDGYRSPWDMLRFTRAARAVRPDVLFYPTVYSYFPSPPTRRSVVVIHDAIAERFPHLTFASTRARAFWGAKVRLAIAQSNLVLTVSDYTAGELVDRLGVRRDRVRVCGEAPATPYCEDVTPEDLSGAHELAGVPPGSRWITYVGGFNPHKRIDTILRAHAELVRDDTPPLYVLLVGALSDAFHACRAELEALVDELGTGPFVRWTGFVPDDELRVLHAAAIACVLPSESEGFGLPAVEAAASGAPVVATTESPLPTLLEGGGEFVHPGDVAAIVNALRRLSRDTELRRRVGDTAKRRARALTWESAARQTLAALEEAAA